MERVFSTSETFFVTSTRTRGGELGKWCCNYDLNHTIEVSINCWRNKEIFAVITYDLLEEHGSNDLLMLLIVDRPIKFLLFHRQAEFLILASVFTNAWILCGYG